MKFPFHPREIIDPEAVDIIRKNAFASENSGQLNEETLQLIYKNNWLRLLIPKSCCGLEWDLPRVVALFEALAWADGNVGWCVNLGAGANMFAGYLEENTAKSVFYSPKTWCAGSGAVSGTAKKAPGGYIISGYWKYASGSAHATHFTANAVLLDEKDKPVQKDGEKVFRSFIFPKEKVAVLDTWKVTGLKATSSHDFEVKEIFVPEDHVFSLVKPSPFVSTAVESPLYHFPFDVLAVINMACMPTGIALHFINLFHELIKTKKPLHSDTILDKNEVVMTLFRKTTNAFDHARQKMYEALAAAWQPYEEGRSADPQTLDELIVSSKNAVQKARKVIFDLYQLCGMSIIFSGSELNKVWRDMAVASQHYLLSPLSQKS